MDDIEPQRPAPRKKFGAALREWAAIRYAELTPLCEWLSEWAGEKKAHLRGAWGLLSVLACLLIGATVYATYGWSKWVFDGRLDDATRFFDASNSFLRGEITAGEKARKDASDELMRFKLDSNEIRRQKDAEIAKLTTVNESLHQRNSLLEALPSTAAGMYSTTTNLLSGIGAFPEFICWINGLKVTNGATIPLNGRSAAVLLKNVSEVSAEQVGASLFLPIQLGSTNFSGSGWRPNMQMTMDVYDAQGSRVLSKTPVADQWIWKADSPLAADFSQMLDTFHISTNFAGKRIEARLVVYAARSKRQELKFFLEIE